MDWKIEVVILPVTDVNRAKAFYADQVGFNVDHDTKISDSMRVVQLTPPGSGCSIVFGTGMADPKSGFLQGIQLVVNDIDAAWAHLTERGVAVSPIRHNVNGEWIDGRGEDWNSFIFFSDPDGNNWTVQERPGTA